MHAWNARIHPSRGSKVAVFDLDGTLVPFSTHHRLLDWIVARGHLKDPHELRPALRRLRDKYTQRLIPAKPYFGKWVTAVRALYREAGLKRSRFAKWAREYVPEIKGSLQTFPRALLEALREEGYALILVSRSPFEIVHPLAELLGFHHAVGNVLSANDEGVFTGRRSRSHVPKLSDVEGIVREFGYVREDSIAIGDSLDDLDLLGWAATGLAFNAEAELRRKLDERVQYGGVVRIVEHPEGVDLSKIDRWFRAQPPTIHHARLEDVFPANIATSIRREFDEIRFHVA